MTYRVFLDANVLFSAVISSGGTPREIPLLSTRGIIHAVISHLIMEEVERNLSRKHPESLDLIPLLIEKSGIEIVENATQEVVEEVISYLSYPPDAAVLAAALSSRADIFITGDKEHFLSKPELESHVNISVMSPRDFLNRLRDERI